jgi:hypothetical protein
VRNAPSACSGWCVYAVSAGQGLVWSQPLQRRLRLSSSSLLTTLWTGGLLVRHRSWTNLVVLKWNEREAEMRGGDVPVSQRSNVISARHTKDCLSQPQGTCEGARPLPSGNSATEGWRSLAGHWNARAPRNPRQTKPWPPVGLPSLTVFCCLLKEIKGRRGGSETLPWPVIITASQEFWCRTEKKTSQNGLSSLAYKGVPRSSGSICRSE